MRSEHLITDSLGFRLEVVVEAGDFANYGQHSTYADAENLKVGPAAIHTLRFRFGLPPETRQLVVAHECYHMFYAVRHLITVDEEMEAEAFGALVKRVHAICG